MEKFSDTDNKEVLQQTGILPSPNTSLSSLQVGSKPMSDYWGTHLWFILFTCIVGEGGSQISIDTEPQAEPHSRQ